MSFQTRNILTLQEDSSLLREELWLREAYVNIVRNLVQSTITKASEFDPFLEQFVGLDHVGYDRYNYQALLEISSYIWASKGGRGALLEKIISSLGGRYSDSTVNPIEIIHILQNKLREENKAQFATNNWTINNNVISKLKFDLANIIGDRLLLLEVKNRVDSGGTSAREESLNKKFFRICKLIESGDKIFVYEGEEYDFVEVFAHLGIRHIEMYMALLFNIDGSEASIEGDRIHGFYSSSRTSMKNYFAEPHLLEDLRFDENGLKVSFKKDNSTISVGMIYGNDVITMFTSNLYKLQMLIDKVFSKKWDDFWLIFNVAISERSILLSNKNNNIIQILNLKENDKEFDELFKKFCAHPCELTVLTDTVNYVDSKISYYPSKFGYSQSKGYLCDCLYAFASYIMAEALIIKRGRIRNRTSKKGFR